MPADLCGLCGSDFCPPERCITHSPLAPEPTPAVETLAEFLNKTNAEIARILADLTKLRRGTPKHRWCDDKYPCTYCTKIRDWNAQLDDHVEQRTIAMLEAALSESEPA